ncbi:hypothetical protein D3C83_198430 [compost metagenome]
MFREIFAARETMKDSAARCSSVLASKNINGFTFCFTCVNNHGHVARARRTKLAFEDVHLHVAR